jgi:predicted GNAT family acetyltransferase
LKQAVFIVKLPALKNSIMKVEREQKNDRGTFYVEQNGQWLAEMAYGMSGDQVVIYHTEVSAELQGQNIGKQLVKAGVEYARENHFQIVPLCPFAKLIMDKVEAFQDVLAPGY